MKITFAGGADAIGASCALLESSGSSLLVDCGIRPGNAQSPLPDMSLLNDVSPEAVFVTHAHADHSGGLPLVAAAFPAVPIVATPPTIDLVTILLNDSLKVMNASGREGDIPLFSKEQVDAVSGRFVPMHQGETRAFGLFRCTFYPAGHILGASMLHVSTPDGHVLFTGDYSAGMQRTVGALLKPAVPVDLLITESTYGNRLHEERKAAETRLIAQVREVTERGGRVLIPCFAVGRAQEILLTLRTGMRSGKLEKVPVFVDGMVRSVCDIYSRHERYVTRTLAHDIRARRHPFFGDTIRPIRSPEERNRALENRPAVFIASSGMLNGGASVFYARALLPSSTDAVLLTGYQDEESPGSRLLSLVGSSDESRTIELQGEPIGVKATVALFGLSAHADRLQMAAFVEACRPRSVILVHGDHDARETLKNSLHCHDALLVHDGESVERSYPVRNRLAIPERAVELPDPDDTGRLRSLLGPPSERAVSAGAIAESWFGKKPSAAVIELFAERLISLGLVRRHDEKRTLLCVLHPALTDALSDESAVIERLKKDNPKGRLLEHCMRIQVPFPVTEFGIQGAYHTARTVLSAEGTRFDSGVQHCEDKTAVEQMAARKVLDLCESFALTRISGVVKSIDETFAESLKAENAKGKCIERCMKINGSTPEFETMVVAGSWCTRAAFAVDGKPFGSDWFRHNNRKVSEHGAASALLAIISVSMDVSPLSAEPGVLDTPAEEPVRDPMTTLNYLRQQRYVKDFGFTDGGGSGPAHIPIFISSAWAVFETGERIESTACEGPSKKAAKRAAARILVGMIGEVI